MIGGRSQLDAQVFDRLWIDAWSAELAGHRPVRAAELIVRLGQLRGESTLIDFGCGIGVIARALTQFGVRVTGIERSADAISDARRMDNHLCRFFLGDWSDYKVDEPFDCAIFWFTTLCGGYRLDFEALRIAYRALRTGGTLLIETRHWDRVPRQFESHSERGSIGCTLFERHTYDPYTRTQTTEECYRIGAETVSRTYHTRRYGFAELRDMCFRAGFDDVEGFDGVGLRLTDVRA